jgi:HEAT repeat protein
VAPTEYVLAAVRRRLTHADARVQRAAIVVLGQWSDQESFEELADFLSSRDVLLAAAAQSSLKAMAGADLGPEASTPGARGRRSSSSGGTSTARSCRSNWTPRIRARCSRH